MLLSALTYALSRTPHPLTTHHKPHVTSYITHHHTSHITTNIAQVRLFQSFEPQSESEIALAPVVLGIEIAATTQGGDDESVQSQSQGKRIAKSGESGESGELEELGPELGPPMPFDNTNTGGLLSPFATAMNAMNGLNTIHSTHTNTSVAIGDGDHGDGDNGDDNDEVWEDATDDSEVEDEEEEDEEDMPPLLNLLHSLRDSSHSHDRDDVHIPSDSESPDFSTYEGRCLVVES